ncbi:MAG TPA: sensor domain-containing diguanylate cyclase [Candidatus Marinimicrobia bacterium]|jgi:diguanylate cyclase (GGDEF)-like protein|nr:sensor domain-containing diguanylate cyclase [Candidatus Neomarinimicrobiota bacterium]|tara:strand:- start:3356 stop:5098 length:1743 start_codon:yes stop_codon:yes gene_type:complete
MFSHINLANFTKALIAFCLAVFIFALLSNTSNPSVEILRYVVLAGVILLLLFYNYTLDENSFENSLSVSASETDHPEVQSSTQLSPAKGLYDELQILVRSTVKAMDQSFETAVYMIDPEIQVFTLQYSDVEGFANTIPSKNEIVSRLLHTEGKAICHQKDVPDAWNELFDARSWRGSECVVISVISLHDNIVGFVMTRINHFSDITEKDKAVLGELGRFVSYGLKNLDFLEIQTNKVDGKQRILDLLSELSFKSEESEALEMFKSLLIFSFQFDCLTISTKLDKGQNCVVKLTEGINKDLQIGSEYNVNGSLHGLPMTNGEIIHTVNWKKDYPNLGRYTTGADDDPGFGAVLGVPIVIDNENLGSIVLERLNPNAFTDRDRENLILIGKVMGTAMYWIQEFDKIYQDASHDGLSKLLNHQTFKERFQDEILRAERFQQYMTVMMFDLDKFKRINDTYGHPYGDYVIQTVSGILKENVRAIDLVARYGGEEFVVILINTAAENAMPVGKRIVKNIADYPYSMDGQDVKMTISAGMSEYPTHHKTMKELIDLADQAMYHVKKQGGNNIILFESIIHNVEKTE